MGIINKFDLYRYIERDASLYTKQSSSILGSVKNALVTSPINTQYLIWSYIKNLRYAEYHYVKSKLNNKSGLNSIYHTVLLFFYYQRLRKISYKTGIQIPINTCGPGLQIWHYGYIIINGNTRIGKNLTIYPGVEIGHKVPGGGCPKIGDNCFIGAGVKIFGDITIGDNVTIGANSVVTKDIPDNCVVCGIPAKIIKYKL